MNERLTPPDWDSYDPNMLVNVADMQYYYENFTEVVDVRSDKNELAIGTLDGRVAALEQSTPVGPGGKGAYLNLGGTPERYPTAEEMVAGDTPESTSFLVVARTDGIYFYNPKSKLLIPPKKGGGTVAVHGQFPDIFDDGHRMKFNGRMGKSGVYTANVADLGLDGNFISYGTTKVLIVTTEDMEYQTALHPDGTASRIFNKGDVIAPWVHHSGGGGGGGGSIDPIVIVEINRRLAALEAKPDSVGSFEALTDVEVDSVLDINGLLYMGADGKVRGGSTNPMLSMGAVHVNPNSVGYVPLITETNVNTTVSASSPVIIAKSDTTRTITLPGIVAHNTYGPTTVQVREGRTTYIVNMSSVNQNVRLNAGSVNTFFKDGVFSSTAIVVPPKTTYVFSPSLMNDGMGNDPVTYKQAWSYMGSIAMAATDMDSLLVEIQDIKDKMEEQRVLLEYTATEQSASKLVMQGLQTTTTDLAERMNNLSLINMSDTPDSFVGNALKSMRVRPSEDGIEFIDSPETAILAALASGNLPIKWNNMKQKIAASSSNISQSNITENAFTCGLGGTTGRQYHLPDIVDSDTVPLPANSVREGRLTILSQQGGGSRAVILNYGCKFSSGGSNTTDNPVIPPGQSWILLPAIYANGDKIWTIIGSFSANDKTPDFSKGYVGVHEKCLTSNFHQNSSQISQTTIANASLVSTTGSTNRTASLPEILPHAHTGMIENTQVRQGKTVTFWGASTAKIVLAPHTGQKISRNGEVLPGNWTLNPGIFETYKAVVLGGVGQWLMVNRCKLDGSPVELDEVNNRLSALEMGGGGSGGADVGPLIIRLDDHQARIEALEAAGGSVDLKPITDRIEVLEDMDLAPITGRVTDVETFANSVADKVEALENKPHPSFFDLTNTPSAGTPGKMVAFNMAGDALVAVDGVDSFRNLKDTPSSFSGQARKAVTVKADESGLEFASLPNLAPLQGEVNDLYNDMIAVNNSQTVQDRRLTALEAASGGSSGSDTFLGLSDTPSMYTPKKYLIVNAAGTGVEESIETTDDVADMSRLAEGVTTGDYLLHQNCLGAPCVMSGEDVITAEDIVNSAVILYSAWQNTNSVRLPKIAPYDASPLPLGHVRAGRITSIYNRTNNNKIIRVTVDPTSTGVILKDRVYNDITNVDLTANRVLKLMPAINAGVPVWVVIENYTCA